MPLIWPLASPVSLCLLFEAFRLILLESKSSVFWGSFLAGREQQGPSWPWSGQALNWSIYRLEGLRGCRLCWRIGSTITGKPQPAPKRQVKQPKPGVVNVA